MLASTAQSDVCGAHAVMCNVVCCRVVQFSFVYSVVLCHVLQCNEV